MASWKVSGNSAERAWTSRIPCRIGGSRGTARSLRGARPAVRRGPRTPTSVHRIARSYLRLLSPDYSPAERVGGEVGPEKFAGVTGGQVKADLSGQFANAPPDLEKQQP